MVYPSSSPEKERDLDQVVKCRFYLGTHQPGWLWQHPHQPYFVSDVRLRRHKRLQPTTVPWALDSGGFTEITRHGCWVTDPRDYITRIRRYVSEIGHLEWAAPQDWMCGDLPLKKTGLTVAIHQERTIDSVLDLKSRVSEAHIAPVLQGRDPDDFLRHADAYESRGVVLAAEPVVGLGSVFKRQGDPDISTLIRQLHARGLRLHAFGFKLRGLRQDNPYLVSADSMAWSFQARRRARHPDCQGARHQNCANCYAYARRWLQELHDEVPLDEGLALAIGGNGFRGPGVEAPFPGS